MIVVAVLNNNNKYTKTDWLQFSFRYHARLMDSDYVSIQIKYGYVLLSLGTVDILL